MAFDMEVCQLRPILGRQVPRPGIEPDSVAIYSRAASQKSRVGHSGRIQTGVNLGCNQAPSLSVTER